MADNVIVREVGLRDGLQLIESQLDTETKIAWVRNQARAGFKEIEVTSIVPPSILPQFADAADVLQRANAIDGLTASVLVPNLKGGLRAIESGARKITFVLSASEAHNYSNVRSTTDDSLTMFRDLVKARANNAAIAISGAIATAFGCSIQGAVSMAKVRDIALAMAEAGADEINLADTVGYAHPPLVASVFEEVSAVVGDIPLAAHFHDTRGLGLANVVAAYDAGVRRFDAALGGLGGCPFAPGASGNIATEDTVYLLECLGANTGVDLDALLNVRQQLQHWLPCESLNGRLSRAGLAKTFRS